MIVINQRNNKTTVNDISLRPPRKEDGLYLFELVNDTGVLDVNSLYAYMLVGEHHSKTSVVAETVDQLVGFISAYLHPEKPDTLFVWQVGVAEAGRGQGLATRMLLDILQRHANRYLRFLETTISPSNNASQALFQGLARRLNTGIEKHELFTSAMFGAAMGSAHEPEYLFHIGPFEDAPNPSVRLTQ